MNGLSRLYNELRAYKRSRALSVAIRIGVLRTLQTQPMAVADIASHLSVAENWLRLLLRVLSDLGLVTFTQKGCHLTEEGALAAKDLSLEAFAGYHFYCYESWSPLLGMLSSKGGGEFHRQHINDPDFCLAFLESLDAIARANLDFLKKECTPVLSGHVLDIGAGPSTLCRCLAADGDIDLTALDLPPIASLARQLYGESNHVIWIEEDFFAWEPYRTFDAVFCSHFLEYCPERHLTAWLRRIRQVLVPGGKAVFVLFLRTDEEQLQSELDLFELSTGLNGDALGHVCSTSEFICALEEEGFSEICLRPFPPGPSYAEFLITCAYSAEKGVINAE